MLNGVKDRCISSLSFLPFHFIDYLKTNERRPFYTLVKQLSEGNADLLPHVKALRGRLGRL
jgi:hypothetical protein